MSWRRALVTGSSAGIGEALARRLAAEGVALVLVARRRERLEHLAAELRSLGAPDVEVLPADLADAAALESVVRRLRDRSAPVDLLVNNAAVGGRGRFQLRPVEAERAQVAINVDAVVALSHAAATAMASSGRGAICNISSIAGNQPGAENAVYGASKAFVTFFSQSLADDLAGTGVTCTVVLPGLTHTEFHTANDIDVQASERFWQSADDVARIALDATAHGRRLVVTGGWNRLATLTSTPRPGRLRARAFGAVAYRVRRALR
jgi:short-subunit dehydrogenase